MPNQPNPKKVSRPKLPKDRARLRTIQVRLNVEDRKNVEAAARASKQTLSDWIRSTINAAIQG